MNYYEHHLGDYVRDTAHLSMIEDGAYRRLIDAYYTREKPLPLDVKDVCRLARAISKPERDAVKIVLEEFFEKNSEGWRHKRCDEEIDKYLAKQPQAEAKKKNDRERQRRSRERRKALFDALRGHGVVPPWDASTEQLQDALSRANTNKSHVPVTRDVTCDNTATQTPDTRHQSPDTSNKTHATTTVEVETEAPSPRVSRQSAVCLAIRAEGIHTVNPQHPELLALIEQGVDIGHFVSAAKLTREKGKGFAYLLGVVKGQMADAKTMAANAATARPPAASETPYQRSMRERWEEASGKKPQTHTGAIIDVTPRPLEIEQ